MNYCLACLVRDGFGLAKWRGENCFADIQDRIPFPLDRLSADLSWQLATWTEPIANRHRPD